MTSETGRTTYNRRTMGVSTRKPDFEPTRGTCNCSYSYNSRPTFHCPYCKGEMDISSTWAKDKAMHVDGAHWHIGCYSLYVNDKLESVMRYAATLRATNVALQAKLGGTENGNG